MITLYHGTDTAYLPSIQAHGLMPQRAKGCDADWHAAAQWSWRKPSVFLAGSAQEAAFFAARLAGANGAILPVHLPDAAELKLVPDEAAGPLIEAYRYEGTIPPAWLDPHPILVGDLDLTDEYVA
jgi:hypothetical protein